MRRTVLACAFPALAAIVFAGSACAASPGAIRLDAKAVAAGRIRTVPLQALERAPRVEAYGVVLGTHLFQHFLRTDDADARARRAFDGLIAAARSADGGRPAR